MNTLDDLAKKKISLKKANDRMKEISQLLFETVYWKFSFGGNVHGVHGSLPVEILHAFLLGPMKTLLQSIFEHTEVPDDMQIWFQKRINKESGGCSSEKPSYKGKKSKPTLFRKAEFERRFRSVTRAAFCQSDRGMPRCPFKHGVTSLTRLCGQEYPGLCLLTMVSLEKIIKGDHATSSLLEKKYSYLLWMSLSLEVLLTMEEYKKKSLIKTTEKKIIYYMKCFREVVGPQREVHSKIGLRTTKFHSLKHFFFYIKMFGSPHNFSGIYLESALKPFLKEQTKRTTRQHNRFLLDLMNRVFEMMVIWSLDRQKERKRMDDNQMLPTNDIGRYKTPTNPAFTLEFSEKANMWVTTIWGGETGSRLYHPKQDDNLGESWVTKMCDLADELYCHKVKCYYSIKVPGPKVGGPPDTFRCDPDFRSYPWNKWGWFDWAIVNFPNIAKETAARIRLWGSVRNANDTEYGMYAVINPLDLDSCTKKHHIFTWMFANNISNDLHWTHFDQIQSVAYVLPASESLPENCNRGKDSAAEQEAYPDDVRDHKYYIVIPQRSTWGDSGWKEIKSEWTPLGK